MSTIQRLSRVFVFFCLTSIPLQGLAQGFVVLHLTDDGTNDADDPTDVLLPPAPTLSPVSADFDADRRPYLSLRKGFKLDDPKRFQDWVAAPEPVDLCITGPVRVILHAASKDFREDGSASLAVTLIDRDPVLGIDTVLSNGSFVADPLSRTEAFERKIFTLDAPLATGSPSVPTGNQLVLRIELGNQLSSDDVWIAYDDAIYPSRIEIPAAECSTLVDEPGFASLDSFNLNIGSPVLIDTTAGSGTTDVMATVLAQVPALVNTTRRVVLYAEVTMTVRNINPLQPAFCDGIVPLVPGPPAAATTTDTSRYLGTPSIAHSDFRVTPVCAPGSTREWDVKNALQDFVLAPPAIPGCIPVVGPFPIPGVPTSLPLGDGGAAIERQYVFLDMGTLGPVSPGGPLTTACLEWEKNDSLLAASRLRVELRGVLLGAATQPTCPTTCP